MLGRYSGLPTPAPDGGAFASLPEAMHGFATIEANINLVATAGKHDTLVATAVMEHAGNVTQVWTVKVMRQSRQRAIGLYRCTQMLVPSPRGT
jgi:acyl-coenzyme A thioesterase PaaI-like protein